MITVDPEKLLPHLFREEYTKMTAVLCRHFGLKHIEVAEDLVSATFLKASEVWPLHGIPENPAAWLYVVAKNKARDYFRKLAIREKHLREPVEELHSDPEKDLAFNKQTIADSQLAMIFAVCNPANSSAGQICLALQVLCGFSLEEIAHAFLTKTETVKKRLQRARKALRNDHFQIQELTEEAIKVRLDNVLKTIYLVFNEGYFSNTADQLVRKDFCSEAIRLMLILMENPVTNTPEANALLALMCYQSSRLDARTGKNMEAVLFEKQDSGLWNRELIERGNYYLVNSCKNREISKYHLEASIAYWHTTQTNPDKWKHILELYNQLIWMEHSPVTALNRVFAFSKVHGNEAALNEMLSLHIPENTYYHSLLGYLYTTLNPRKAISHYEQAAGRTQSLIEKQTLLKELRRLKQV